MKKIFSKFTKERDERFQIETGIYLEDGVKKVAKQPLGEASVAHVERMFENYVYFSAKGIDLFTPCKRADGGVILEFVEGDTYYNLLLEKIKNGNVEKLAKVLEKYRKIVESACDGLVEEFKSTPEFEEVFGKHEWLEGKKACRKLDIDLTLDNLILTADGSSRIIDYEWIFDFPVPVDFVYYRAVLALYIKHGKELNAVAEQDSLYQMFGIRPGDAEIFRQMNDSFNQYVQGGEDSYENALKAYEKKSRPLSGWITDVNYFAQLFMGADCSFSEEKSQVFKIEEDQNKVNISIDLRPYKDLRVLRLDPLNLPCSVKNLRFQILENKREREVFLEDMRHNAVFFKKREFIFEDGDPQVIWEIPETMKPERIWISYEITSKNLGENDGVKAALKLAKQNRDELLAVIEDLNKKNEELGSSLSDREQRLNYIQGTRAYKLFLKKKVLKVFAGEKKNENKKG